MGGGDSWAVDVFLAVDYGVQSQGRRNGDGEKQVGYGLFRRQILQFSDVSWGRS